MMHEPVERVIMKATRFWPYRKLALNRQKGEKSMFRELVENYLPTDRDREEKVEDIIIVGKRKEPKSPLQSTIVGQNIKWRPIRIG